MKKFFTYLGVVFAAAFCFLSFYAINARPLFSTYSDSFEIYYEKASSGRGIERVSRAEFFKAGNIKGESCTVENGCAAQIIKDLGAELLFTEQTEEGVSYYCFWERSPYGEILRGKKVNLHVFEGKTQTKIGSPIIYGSF